MSWSVRRATRDDMPELAALCSASVGRDDYVIEGLPWELRHSVVHVALDPKDRIVGMTVYRTCIDGSGWLAMARTHPMVRRKGVNRALVESFVAKARESGVPFLRLWTNATNAEGTATFAALGFREVGWFVRIESDAARGPTKATRRPLDESLWRRIEESSLVKMGRGYVPHGWSFVPATRAVASAIAAKDGFWAWDENVLVLQEPPADAEPEAAQFAVWAGRPQPLLEEACRQAAAAGHARAGTYVPLESSLLSEARRVGFQVVPWGSEAILCELAVPAGEERGPIGATGSARAGRTRS